MKSANNLIILILALILAVNAYSQTPAEQLKQMVTQLQTSPSDNVLRERVIKLAATMKPAPAIPEEANRSNVKGNTFLEETKTATDKAAGYGLAIAAYREAVRLAPWWGDAYFNLGVALGKAGKYDEAIASLRLSMAAVPADSKEARDAQNHIYALEAKAELVSKQAAAKAEQEELRRKYGPFLGKWFDLDGKPVVEIQVQDDGLHIDSTNPSVIFGLIRPITYVDGHLELIITLSRGSEWGRYVLRSTGGDLVDTDTGRRFVRKP